MELMPVNMLWVGPSLGRIERLSIASFLAAGHRVRLHAYGPVTDVPGGCETVDAGTLLLPEETQALRHRETGSYALASDLFRYRIMQAGEGYWSDTDVVCLRPVTIEGPHVFGWESKRNINGALLYLAPESPVLREVIDSFRPDFVPPWLRLRRSLPFHVKRLRGKSFGPADLPWGAFGPRALTYLARKHKVDDQAQPVQVFYPLPLSHAREIFSAAYKLPDAALQSSLTIHLWNERLKDLKHKDPEPGSVLDLLYQKHGV